MGNGASWRKTNMLYCMNLSVFTSSEVFQMTQGVVLSGRGSRFEDRTVVSGIMPEAVRLLFLTAVNASMKIPAWKQFLRLFARMMRAGLEPGPSRRVIGFRVGDADGIVHRVAEF